MLIPVIIVAIECIILFLLSRRVTETMYLFWFLLTKTPAAAINILMIGLFPGTVVHELAHMFTAEVLGVHTGKLTLMPELTDPTSVRAGSVAIQETGPFRRTLIGIAPIFWGTGVLLTLSYFVSTLAIDWQTQWSLLLSGIVDWKLIMEIVGTVYLAFSVSNAMFSSREDMKGVWPILILVVLIVAALSIMGVRIVLPPWMTDRGAAFFWSFAQTLGWVVALNCIMLITTTMGIAAIRKTIRQAGVRER